MPAPPDRERLQRLLGGEALADLRQRLRKRYAAAAAPADGFTLNNLAPAERDALAGLLGRPRGDKASLRLSHRRLDAALQAADLAHDLRAALECLDGPIVDTRSAREREERAWAALFAEYAPEPLATALADTRTQGSVKRLTGQDINRARSLIGQAESLLARLPASGIARARLAADVLGDAHALDTGRPVATLLRRALDHTARHARMRDLWAEHGVLVNELAKPVVTLNLPASGNEATDRLINAAAQAGEPLHLSLRALARRPPTWRTGQRIHICENPEIVAAAADALEQRCPPLISLDGQLSAAPRTLLDQLAAAGCRFYYHGDFDWPGIAIANGIVRSYRAQPWRFSARDYAPKNGPALAGEPVEACWDTALANRMRAAGVAIHEEAQLPELLADLAGFGD